MDTATPSVSAPPQLAHLRNKCGKCRACFSRAPNEDLAQIMSKRGMRIAYAKLTHQSRSPKSVLAKGMAGPVAAHPLGGCPSSYSARGPSPERACRPLLRRRGRSTVPPAAYAHPEPHDRDGESPVPADDPKEEPNTPDGSAIELLQGAWQATSFRTSDEEFNQRTRTQSSSFSIVIEKDRFTWKYANGREKHWRIKISSDDDPKQIDFSREDSDTRRLGIYSLKQDELTICFSSVEPVEERYRPTDFTAEEGSGRILMTVKRPSDVAASDAQADQPKGSSLDVRLIDPATEKPFSYGRVELTRTDDPRSRSEKLCSSLSGDVFEFADLPPGRYALHASVRSLHPDQPRYVADQAISEVEIVAGEDKEISVRMRPVPLAKDEIATRWPYVTTGTVTDDQGKPIEGVDIYVYVGSGGTIQGWRGAPSSRIRAPGRQSSGPE